MGRSSGAGRGRLCCCCCFVMLRLCLGGSVWMEGVVLSKRVCLKGREMGRGLLLRGCRRVCNLMSLFEDWEVWN